MLLSEIYEKLKLGVLPSKKQLHHILTELMLVLSQEENVLFIQGPVYVVGDLHGQYYDFLKIFDTFGKPTISVKYLFLGDYVDRGFNSVELFISVAILKILHKNEVFLLRGNHESKSMGINYTLRDECRIKYDDTIFLMLCEAFLFLPVCAIIDMQIFCIHGGITPTLNVKDLRKINRFEELPEFYDVYWSDPDESVSKFVASTRGAGYLFSANDVQNFLKDNDLIALVRSHQLVHTGFDSKFDGKVLTVWSAPNYGYTHENGACVLYVHQTKMEPRYFEKAIPQYVEDQAFMQCQMFYKN